MSTEAKPNDEDIALEAIKKNMHSVAQNKSKNSIEFVLDHCKLMSISYEDNSVRLSLDLSTIYPSTESTFSKQQDEKPIIEQIKVKDDNDDNKDNVDEYNTNTENEEIDKTRPLQTPKSPEDVDKENMMNKLTILQNDTNNSSDKDGTDDNKLTEKQPKKKKTVKKTKKENEEKTVNTKRSKSKTKKIKTEEKTKEIATKPKKITSKSAKPIESMMKNNKKKGNNKRRSNRSHLRQRSKTTDDIDSFSIMSHDKWSYYATELTSSQQIRVQGFADIKCRYKYAHEMKFGSKLKREDTMEFKVPLNTQRIYAYIVEDCVADGTNGEIIKVQGGTGKKFVRLYVKSQMNHGVHMKLHVWYK